MKIETAIEADASALTQLLSVVFAQEAEFQPNPEVQRRGLLQIMMN
jgi:hypothetical protein